MDTVVTNSPTSYFSASNLASFALSTTGGYILGGPLGAIAGAALNSIDTYLIDQKLADKHYLSQSAFWAKTVTYPLYQLSSSASIGGLLGMAGAVGSLALPYFMNDFFSFEEKLSMPVESFHLINQLFDHERIFSTEEACKLYHSFTEGLYEGISHLKSDVQKILHNEFLSTYFKGTLLNLSKVGLEALFLIFLGSYSSNLFVHNLITQNPTLHWSDLKTLSPFLKQAAKVLSLLTLKETANFYFDKKIEENISNQYRTILKQSTELLIKNGNGRKLSSLEGGKELIQNLTPDLTTLMYRGASRLNYILSETTKALLSLQILSTLASTALAPYALIALAYHQILGSFSKHSQKIYKEFISGEIYLWDVKYDITHNVDQINLRDGDDFVQHQFTKIMTQQSILKTRVAQCSKTETFYGKLQDLASKVVDVFYYSTALLQKQIPLEKIPSIHHSINSVYQFLGSNVNLASQTKELVVAKERLTKFFSYLDVEPPTQVKRAYSSHKGIQIKDYSLYLFGDEILHIPYLQLKPNEHYAITGKSGCGKSSFLIDLKQGVLGALTSSRQLSLEVKHPSEIMFIDQDLYFPTDCSLFETVCFPVILDDLSIEQQSHLKNQIIELFKELEIDQYATENNLKEGLIAHIDTQDFNLSGGQRKKVAAIQAILRKPSILIMDETFTGLDKRSLALVQNALNKYLPDTLILSIDHHAEDNNQTGFYTSNLHFENATAFLKSL